MAPWFLFLVFPAAASGALSLAQSQHPSRLRIATIGLAIVVAIAFGLHGRPYTESSPLTMVFWGIGPVVIAALTLALGRSLHWPLILRWIAATVAASLVLMPLFMLSCILADCLPIPGCFF
jgi:hypothetical protein